MAEKAPSTADRASTQDANGVVEAIVHRLLKTRFVPNRGSGTSGTMMRPPPPPEWPADDPRRTPVALRRELIQLGYNDRALARLVAAHVLAKPRRGAYVDGPAFARLGPVGRHAVRTRAVMKQANTEVVASHTTAALEYDAPDWGLDLETTHVTRLDGAAGRSEAGVRQHCGRIVDGDVLTRNGIAVMSPTRTALEVTMVASAEASLGIVNHLLHRNLTTKDLLVVRYESESASMEQWPNSLTTDLVLRLARAEIESLGESRTWWLCFQHSIPMPVPQYQVKDDRGAVVARVDFAWPEYKVFLEFDGKVKYQELLKPGETVVDVVLREKRREELVCRLTGWRCIRITWADLENPEATTAMILRELTRSDAA